MEQWDCCPAAFLFIAVLTENQQELSHPQ